MNRFQSKNSQNRISLVLPGSILLFALLIFGFIYSVSVLTTTADKGSREYLENTVNHDITHCYAVCGHFPDSIAYLEEHYGLTYDHNKYIVDYEYIGGNIRPTVTILTKN